ncbi:HpcH/HpaI aldolase/citrate lyase family protein [Oceanibacterium hippocampi]|uniref:(3S)-malyl-CoA thioesterase n=1 Tax=Oceanibacterium hippocampi TaxID=745714 RepID=A0A1Y5SW51_9PROT|nr:CoA ester lyase [Oceanibacterium hippocampi]SLN46521.1 (3S)-malyl-CoA thioesterase [Oceanibacterium hippocampi]
MTSRPVRSILFVPGDSERKIARSAESGTDAVIFDMEDSVHPDRKAAARDITAAALATPLPARRFVRVNSLESGYFEADIAILAAAPPEVVMLPKCGSLDDIRVASDAMAAAGLPAETVRLLPVATETARAVRNLMRSDWSHPRLYGLTWGAEDISADIGAFANRVEGRYEGVFALARDLCLLAAREAGVLAFDTAFTDVRDLDGCRAEATAAYRAGFDGKLAIHPAQVSAINEAFTPSEAQVDWARRVIAALDASGEGVALLDGRMIDMPHQRNAERILRAVEPSGN